RLPRLRIVQDVLGDGSRDLLVPGMGTLGVYRRTGGRFSKVARLEVSLEAQVGERRRGTVARRLGSLDAVEGRYRFPSVHVGDADGDGQRDIILSQEDRAAVYVQRAGTFDARPTFERDFAIRNAEEIKEAHSEAALLVTDVDGDGIADLIARKQV